MANSVSFADSLQQLRARADQDFAAPAGIREPGRHQLDIPELGIRVALTRAIYPNRPGGVDSYAVTISRLALDHGPAEPEVQAILAAAFGSSAEVAVERPAGPLIRTFRLPA